MKKLFSLLVLSILLISLWGCKNKTAEFVVEKAFYYETNVETKSFFNNATIAKDKLYRDYIILVTDFNYEVKSSNPNDLPKVKVGMINVTYVVKLNGKELLSTVLSEDTATSKADYKEESDGVFVISSTSNIKVPITEKGTYEVICYANYYLNKKRIAEPCEFKFKVD